MSERRFEQKSAAGPTPDELAEWEAKLEGSEGILSGDEADIPLERAIARGTGRDLEEWSDPEDRRIAAQLATESVEGHISFMGSPISMEQMDDLISTADELLGSGENRVGIHSSCVSGDDCVIVYRPSGDQHHISTRLVPGFRRDRFIQRMDRRGVRVVEK
jgi:hypothetical protein